MPTTLGAPALPAAAPPAPRTHSCVTPTPARTPRVRGAAFGRVFRVPIFRLPLRFIWAATVGPSSEEAGASSGWLGALVFGGDTQSRRHRGAGCVRWLAPRGARWLAGSLAPGCGAAAGANPCPGAGRRRAAGRHCLACECTSLTCKSGCPVASREVRVARRGQEPPGRGRGAAAPPPCPVRPGHPPILSFLFSLHWRAPKSPAQERLRVTANSCRRASALFLFELFDISRCFLVSRCCWALFGSFSPLFRWLILFGANS